MIVIVDELNSLETNSFDSEPTKGAKDSLRRLFLLRIGIESSGGPERLGQIILATSPNQQSFKVTKPDSQDFTTKFFFPSLTNDEALRFLESSGLSTGNDKFTLNHVERLKDFTGLIPLDLAAFLRLMRQRQKGVAEVSMRFSTEWLVPYLQV
jgi:hypothetical protein